MIGAGEGVIRGGRSSRVGRVGQVGSDGGGASASASYRDGEAVADTGMNGHEGVEVRCNQSEEWRSGVEIRSGDQEWREGGGEWDMERSTCYMVRACCVYTMSLGLGKMSTVYTSHIARCTLHNHTEAQRHAVAHPIETDM
jgi:hypothetical protein